MGACVWGATWSCCCCCCLASCPACTWAGGGLGARTPCSQCAISNLYLAYIKFFYLCFNFNSSFLVLCYIFLIILPFCFYCIPYYSFPSILFSLYLCYFLSPFCFLLQFILIFILYLPYVLLFLSLSLIKLWLLLKFIKCRDLFYLIFGILDEPPCFVRQCQSIFAILLELFRGLVSHVLLFIGCTVIHNCSSSGSLVFAHLGGMKEI